MVDLKTYNGEYLKKQLQLNRRSITVSAKQLGISVEELQAYFRYDKFDLDLINHIIMTLNLRHVIEDSYSVTTKCMDEYEAYEKKIKMAIFALASLTKSLQELYLIAVEHSPESLYKQVIEDAKNNVAELMKKLDF